MESGSAPQRWDLVLHLLTNIKGAGLVTTVTDLSAEWGVLTPAPGAPRAPGAQQPKVSWEA